MESNSHPELARIFAAGTEAKVRILIADKPQRETVPGDIEKLIRRMGLQGQVELIKEQGKTGDQKELKRLVEKYRPTVILVFTGQPILLDSYVLEAVSRNRAHLVVRAGAGYENISVEGLNRYPEWMVPLIRSHGLGDSMTEYTVRVMVALQRLRAGKQSAASAVDVSQDPGLGSLLQMSPAVYEEALQEAIKRDRGEMTPFQRKLLFGPMSKREFLALAKQLEGQKIGILGFGVIGEKVVQRLNEIKKKTGVSFEILAATPSLSNPKSPRAKLAKRLGVRIVDEKELLQTADIVSVHIPSSDGNKNYLTAKRFEGRTKPLIFINTARRDIVNDDLFTTRLPFKVVAFGDLDFDKAGTLVAIRTAHPKTFFIAPHIGGITENSAQGAVKALLKKLREVLPILLGKRDPASIRTINGPAIVPVGKKAAAGTEDEIGPVTAGPALAAAIAGFVEARVRQRDPSQIEAAEVILDNPAKPSRHHAPLKFLMHERAPETWPAQIEAALDQVGLGPETKGEWTATATVQDLHRGEGPVSLYLFISLRPAVSAAGMEEKFYDAVWETLDPTKDLEWNLKAAVQAVDQVRRLAPADPFYWLKTGIKGEEAFVAFEVAGEPMIFWLNSEKILSFAKREDAAWQLSYAALLGGQIGPKKFSVEFLKHHPDEPSDFAITFTAGQILDQLIRRNGRVTLVLTKNKKEIASRFAQGAVGRYDGDDPMTFLWMIPGRVDVYFDESSDPGDEARRRLSSAGMNVKGVFATPAAVGQAVAGEVLKEWREKVIDGDQYVFGLVTGSTPKPFLDALIPQLKALKDQPRSGLLERLSIVVPDDHVEQDADGQFHNITRANSVSAFTTRENDFVKPVNEKLPAAGLPGMSMDRVMVPEVGKAATQLDELPGIDRYFLTFGPQHVFMQFAGEAENVSLVDPAALLQAGAEQVIGPVAGSGLAQGLAGFVEEQMRLRGPAQIGTVKVVFDNPQEPSRHHAPLEFPVHERVPETWPDQIQSALGEIGIGPGAQGSWMGTATTQDLHRGDGPASLYLFISLRSSAAGTEAVIPGRGIPAHESSAFRLKQSENMRTMLGIVTTEDEDLGGIRGFLEGSLPLGEAATSLLDAVQTSQLNDPMATLENEKDTKKFLVIFWVGSRHVRRSDNGRMGARLFTAIAGYANDIGKRSQSEQIILELRPDWTAQQTGEVLSEIDHLLERSTAGMEQVLVEAAKAIGRVKLETTRPAGQAHILYNDASLAALFFLHLPEPSGPLNLSPNIAVVDPARLEALVTIAESAGFTKAQVALWILRYVVLYDPAKKGDIQRATRVAKDRIAQRLLFVEPVKLFTLPDVLSEFGIKLKSVLESFGLTFQSGTLDDRAIEALYNAAQA